MYKKVTAARERKVILWRNTTELYGLAARLFHWTTAVAFIGAYIIVYYVIWVIADNKNPDYVRVLNVHWILGLITGFLVIPRLIWRMLDVQPDEVAGSSTEHLLAKVAHLLLYALMIVLPITGYLGTRRGTDFYLFFIPSFAHTDLFAWISAQWDITFKEFEQPLDAVHHFLGKWVAWPVVGLHIAAALYHHWVRRDMVLYRMLGVRPKRNERAADAAKAPA